MDFLRVTLRGEALRKFLTSFKHEACELLRGAPQGFDRAERYATGWVRRSQPWGGGDYESFEFPGAVPPSELERVRSILGPFVLAVGGCGDEVVPTAVHFAWDVIGQQFPRADEWFRRYKELEASSTAEEPGYTTKGGARTCYIGSRQSDLFWRIYDKGRKLQREGDSSAPTDWVRVECEFHKGWAANAAFEAAIVGHGHVFAVACTQYFKGELAREWLPTMGGDLGAGPKERPGHLSKIRALLNQYGQTLRVLADLGILGDVLGLVPEGSRMTSWRAEKFRKELVAYGTDRTLSDLAAVLGQKGEEAGPAAVPSDFFV